MSTAQDTPVKGGRRKLSKKGRVDLAGKSVSAACIAIVVLLVITLIFMVAQHGLATFFVNGISPIAFLTGTEWNPHVDDANGMPTVGALPMIVGSFAVTLLSTIIAIPSPSARRSSSSRSRRSSAVRSFSRWSSFWSASPRSSTACWV